MRLAPHTLQGLWPGAAETPTTASPPGLLRLPRLWRIFSPPGSLSLRGADCALPGPGLAARCSGNQHTGPVPSSLMTVPTACLSEVCCPRPVAAAATPAPGPAEQQVVLQPKSALCVPGTQYKRGVDGRRLNAAELEGGLWGHSRVQISPLPRNWLNLGFIKGWLRMK